MTLSTVTLKWDVTDLVQSGVQAVLSITPTAQLSDGSGHVLVAALPRRVQFSGGTGQLAGIVANDSGVLPANAGYLVSVATAAGAVVVPQFQTQVLYANGATQWLDQLVTVPVLATGMQYLPLAPRVVALADAPVTLVSAAAGNDFRWAITGSHTLGAPSGAVDGQIITVDIQQPASGGPWTPLFASGAGGYAFGADGQPAWSTAANAVDEVGFRYHAIKNAWLCQGWKLGF